MKHSLSITLALLAIFLLTQMFGLFTISKYEEVKISPTGEVNITHPDTIFGPQPEVKVKTFTFIPIMFIILLGTALIFMLIKFRLGGFWKYGFVFGVFVALAVSFEVYLGALLGVVVAILLSYWKVFRPNVIVHNLTEIFIYPGIAIVLLPLLNVVSVMLLLLFISIYDFIAVFQSKHMIKLAKFQTGSRAFAGLYLPYNMKYPKKEEAASEEMTSSKGGGQTAILGGGDIAFPLLFSAAVFESLVLNGALVQTALLQSFIISATSTIALAILLFAAKKQKFYPAMPILSVGCVVGYGIIFLL